jgi:hypothetical protein
MHFKACNYPTPFVTYNYFKACNYPTPFVTYNSTYYINSKLSLFKTLARQLLNKKDRIVLSGKIV